MTCDPLRRTKIARLEFQRALMASVHLGYVWSFFFCVSIRLQGGTVRHTLQFSKELWKSNFRRYGQMEKQRWESQTKEEKESEERR